MPYRVLFEPVADRRRFFVPRLPGNTRGHGQKRRTSVQSVEGIHCGRTGRRGVDLDDDVTVGSWGCGGYEELGLRHVNKDSQAGKRALTPQRTQYYIRLILPYQRLDRPRTQDVIRPAWFV